MRSLATVAESDASVKARRMWPGAGLDIILLT